MGGGWGKQGSGIPLSERVRPGAAPPGGMAGAARADAAGRAVSRPATEPACPARHCWVADAVDGDGVKRPGLLVEWRQVRAGWEGRVVYAARLRPDGDAPWAVVEEWVPAALLTPL